MPTKIIDLKECGGDTEKIEYLLNKTEARLSTYEIKSISLTEDRGLAIIYLKSREGCSYFNMLNDAADARKNENQPASSGNLFDDAMSVLLNHTDGLIRIFIAEKTSDEYSRWSNVFKFIFQVYLGANNKLRVEIISFYPDDKLLRDLKGQYPENIKVFGLTDKKIKDAPSFMVIEPIGYWMEVLEKENMIRGFANFGDERGTRKFIECFERLKFKILQPA